LTAKNSGALISHSFVSPGHQNPQQPSSQDGYAKRYEQERGYKAGTQQPIGNASNKHLTQNANYYRT
jgi:hypothetical protein